MRLAGDEGGKVLTQEVSLLSGWGVGRKSMSGGEKPPHISSMDFWHQLNQGPSLLEGRAAHKGFRKLPAVLPSRGSSGRVVFREPEAARAGLLPRLGGWGAHPREGAKESLSQGQVLGLCPSWVSGALASLASQTSIS